MSHLNNIYRNLASSPGAVALQCLKDVAESTPYRYLTTFSGKVEELKNKFENKEGAEVASDEPIVKVNQYL